MERAAAAILCLLVLAGSLTALPYAQAVTPHLDPQRVLAPEETSKGLRFQVTVTFGTPPANHWDLRLEEGNGGVAWFLPAAADGYELFRVVAFEATPEPSHYDGESTWRWDPDTYPRKSTIQLTYTVEVDGAVPYGAYTVDGTVAVLGSQERGAAGVRPQWAVDMAADRVVTVVPPSLALATDLPVYVPGQELRATAAVVYGDGTPATGGSVEAEIRETEATFPLLEEADREGVYGGGLVLSPEAEAGIYTLEARFADAHGNEVTTTTAFEVIPPVIDGVLDVEVALDATTYQVSETVSVEVSVRDPDGTLVPTATGTLTVSPTGGTVVLVPEAPGQLGAQFALPPGSPFGPWEVTAEVHDTEGNVGTGTATFAVVPAAFAVAVGPLPAEVPRLARVPLRVQVAYPSEAPVAGALVVAAWPGVPVVLAETAPGRYEGTLTPSRDFPLGTAEVTVSVFHRDGSGEGRTSLRVRSAPLSLAVSAEPSTTQPGDPVLFAAVVRYPDGAVMRDGAVRAEVRRDGTAVASLDLLYDMEADAFVAAWLAPADLLPGEYEVAFRAEDPYGNGGSGTVLLELRETLPGPILAGLVLQATLIVAALGTAALVVYLVRRRRPGGGP